MAGSGRPGAALRVPELPGTELRREATTASPAPASHAKHRPHCRAREPSRFFLPLLCQQCSVGQSPILLLLLDLPWEPSALTRGKCSGREMAISATAVKHVNQKTPPQQKQRERVTAGQATAGNDQR